MNILIPMAGLGTRFKGSKYTGPKPLNDIAGRTMIERALDSFKLDAHFIFVMQNSTIFVHGFMIPFAMQTTTIFIHAFRIHFAM